MLSMQNMIKLNGNGYMALDFDEVALRIQHECNSVVGFDVAKCAEILREELEEK